MTYNFQKTFFSEERARAFAEALRKDGIAADIWTGYGAFRQMEYTVKWNLNEDKQ